MRGLPESTPSQNIPPFKHLYVTLSDCTPPSQNIHPPFKHLRSYATLPEYTRLLYKATLLESTLPLFSQLHATLPWSTPPPQNIPPSILKHLCDPPRIHPLLLWIYPSPYKHLYATHPESTPPSQNRYPFFGNYMRHSHNLPLPSWIYPPFSTKFYICDATRIYPALPKSTPPSRIYPPPPPRYATLSEYTHSSRIYPLLHHYMRHSHNLRSLP